MMIIIAAVAGVVALGGGGCLWWFCVYKRKGQKAVEPEDDDLQEESLEMPSFMDAAPVPEIPLKSPEASHNNEYSPLGGQRELSLDIAGIKSFSTSPSHAGEDVELDEVSPLFAPEPEEVSRALGTVAERTTMAASGGAFLPPVHPEYPEQAVGGLASMIKYSALQVLGSTREEAEPGQGYNPLSGAESPRERSNTFMDSFELPGRASLDDEDSDENPEVDNQF